MSTPQSQADPADGIRVDAEAVARRQNTRIAQLTLEVDQWQTAYEAQGRDLAIAQAELQAMRENTTGGGARED